MKKLIYVLICVLFVLVTIGIAAFKNANISENYLRIHIKGNSNTKIDSDAKFLVKDAIVEYLTEKLKNVSSYESAKNLISDNIVSINRIATKTLVDNGINYYSKVKLEKQEFPLRKYGNLVLDAGIYDALVIDLGEGKGDNWWCLVYPNLCFNESTAKNVEFRLKFLIKSIFE